MPAGAAGGGTDYIDRHIYAASLNMLPLVVTYVDTARAAGKGVGISEAWLKKVTDTQMQGSGFAIVQAPSADPYDNFSLWEPLDSQLLTELVKLAYWKNLYFLSPFSFDWFFAYLDYSQYGSATAAQQTTAINAAAPGCHARRTVERRGASLRGGHRAGEPAGDGFGGERLGAGGTGIDQEHLRQQPRLPRHFGHVRAAPIHAGRHVRHSNRQRRRSTPGRNRSTRRSRIA